jgi:PAB-dependent poly(A)-specific ribonuclease subunit 2
MYLVAHSMPTAPAASRWYLFNDFLVEPIKAEDALTFGTSWKLPSVIAYQVKVANNVIDNSWKQKLDTSLLYIDHK